MSNLDGASLRGADCRDLNAVGISARNIDMRDSNLCGARFDQSDLSGANLNGTTINAQTSFKGTNLINASIQGATFLEADGATQRPLRYADITNQGGLVASIDLAQERANNKGMNFSELQSNQASTGLGDMPKLAYSDAPIGQDFGRSFDPGNIPGKGDGPERGGGIGGTA